MALDARGVEDGLDVVVIGHAFVRGRRRELAQIELLAFSGVGGQQSGRHQAGQQRSCHSIHGHHLVLQNLLTDVAQVKNIQPRPQQQFSF